MKDCTVLFSGSFDLFHKGHLEFLKFLKTQYKQVIIAISNNEHKPNQSSLLIRYNHLIDVLNQNQINDVLVIINFGLTVDIAQLMDCKYLVRSYLNQVDYEYEHQLKLINTCLNKHIKTKLYYVKTNKEFRSSLLIKNSDDVKK